MLFPLNMKPYNIILERHKVWINTVAVNFLILKIFKSISQQLSV